MVKLSLYDDETVVLVYPGEVDCCKHLLRTLRQMATSAMIDGTRTGSTGASCSARWSRSRSMPRATASCARKMKKKWSACISC